MTPREIVQQIIEIRQREKAVNLANEVNIRRNVRLYVNMDQCEIDKQIKDVRREKYLEEKNELTPREQRRMYPRLGEYLQGNAISTSKNTGWDPSETTQFYDSNKATKNVAGVSFKTINTTLKNVKESQYRGREINEIISMKEDLTKAGRVHKSSDYFKLTDVQGKAKKIHDKSTITDRVSSNDKGKVITKMNENTIQVMRNKKKNERQFKDSKNLRYVHIYLPKAEMNH